MLAFLTGSFSRGSRENKSVIRSKGKAVVPLIKLVICSTICHWKEVTSPCACQSQSLPWFKMQKGKLNKIHSISAWRQRIANKTQLKEKASGRKREFCCRLVLFALCLHTLERDEVVQPAFLATSQGSLAAPKWHYARCPMGAEG